MTDEIMKLLKTFAQIPCCSCCMSDESYKEQVIDGFALIGVVVEWKTISGKNGGERDCLFLGDLNLSGEK